MNRHNTKSSNFDWHVNQPEWFECMGKSFDVRMAKQLIKDKPTAIQVLTISSSIPMCPLMGVSESASFDTVDLSFPVIVATLESGNSLPIDGWHRIAKAGKEINLLLGN